MARTLKCPHCRHKFKVDDDLQGNFSCPSCERTLKISPRKKQERRKNTSHETLPPDSDETLPPDHDPDATAAPDFKLDEVQQTLEGESDHGQTISEFMQERGYQGGVELGEGDPGKTKSTEIIEAEDGKKYKVGEMVARGGMGAILEAMDLNIRRSVAMKVMLSKKEVEERVVLRFIEEAQITGQLEHPNIVPVHELGVDGSGNVFYTMKLIQGLTLKHILRRIAEGDQEIIERFPLMHLINVFLKICDAMSLAHAKGVVHRDLKPENIMVGDFGEVSVLDWGLAKVVGRDERALPEGRPANKLPAVESIRKGETGSQTLSGTVLGTPAFMAPEQAYGNIDEIDPRTDVYALGGILYSILTLRDPVEADSVHAVLIKVTDGDIRPPEYWNPVARQDSGKNGAALAHCPGGQVPESLSAVAMKALSLKHEDRYQSVKEFQMEIEAWQGGYATQAEQAGLGRQLKLLIGRHKTEFALAASAAMLVFAVITGSLFKVNSEKRIAVAEKVKAVKAQQKAEQENYFNAIFVADKKIENFARGQAGDLLLQSPGNLRGWEWGRLMYLCNLDLITLRGHSDAVRSVSFSPNGEQLLTAGFDGAARLWNARTGKVIRSLKGHRGAVYCASFSKNGKQIVTTSVDKTAILWDAQSGEIVRTLKGHDSDVRSGAISPDGQQILTGGTDNTIRIWPPSSSKDPEIISGHTGPINSVAWSQDGTRFLTASDDRTARLWDSRTGKEIRALTQHTDFVYCASYSPNGQLLVTGSRDRIVRIWDAERGGLLKSLKGHRHSVYCAAFSPDSRRLATGSYDKTVRIWDAETGQLLRTIVGGGWILSLAFSPDGDLLLTGSEDRTARLWSTAKDKTLKHLALTPLGVGFTPDGRAAPRAPEKKQKANAEEEQLAAALAGKELAKSALRQARRKKADKKRAQVAIQGHKDRIFDASYSPDGKKIVSASWDQTAKIWNVRSGKEILSILHPDKVLQAEFSSDGKHVLTASADKTATLWNAETGKRIRQFTGHKDWVLSARLSPDGSQVLTGSRDKTARLWNAGTGKLIQSFRAHSESVRAVSFSPDGNRLLTASADKTAIIWNADTGKKIRVLEGHSNYLNSAAFSKDGQRIVTSSDDRTARIWQTKTGKELAILKGHTFVVHDAFFLNGKQVVTASADKTAKLWDARTGREILTLGGHQDTIWRATAAPNGRDILTAGSHAVIIYPALDWRKTAEQLEAEKLRKFVESQRR